MALSKIVIKVGADTADVKVAFQQINVLANQVGNSFTNVTNQIAQQAKVSAGWGISLSSAIYNVKAAFSALSTVVGGFYSFMRDAVKISAEYNSAITALIGVSRAYGLDSDKVLAATKHLTDDGLLPLGAAAKSVKNLLATGFDLKQSVDIMNAFKDSATNARQSTYSFADAIVTATEGLKNTRSVQVDNVGITKNLSVIMKEYGFQMQDLTDKTKGLAARQALHNGLMREAAAQAGDAARSLQTYSGATTALDSAYLSLKAQIGDNITRSASFMETVKTLAGWVRNLTTFLVENKNGFYLVSDALEFIVRSMATVVRAIDILHTAFTNLDNVIRQTMAGLGKAITDALFPLNRFLSLMSEKVGGAKILETMFHLPEGTVAGLKELAAAADEMMFNANKHIDENNASLTKWHGTIGAAATQLDALADRIHNMRGKTIELSAAARDAGDVITNLGGGGAGKDPFKNFRKHLEDLTTQIKTAMANGTDMDELIRLFGKDASLSAEKAKAWGIYVQNAVTDVAAAFRNVQFDKIFSNLNAGFEKFANKRFTATFKKLQDDMHDTAVAAIKLPKTMQKLDFGFEDFFNKRFLANFKKGAATMKASLPGVLAELRGPFEDVFGKLAVQLPGVLERGFKQGGVQGVLLELGEASAANFASGFSRANARVAKELAAGVEGAHLSFKEKFLGIGASAVEGFVTGFRTGLQDSGVGGFLTSTIGGFAQGFLTAGPIGGLVGLGTGLAGYMLGAAKNREAEAANVANAQSQLLTQYHGMKSLMELWQKADFHFDMRGMNPLTVHTQQAFNQAVAQMNSALDAYNEKLKAIDASTAAVNKRTAVLAGQFAPLVKARDEAKGKDDQEGVAAATSKMKALAQQTQPEFERLGIFVQNVFAAMVHESGDAVAAINALAPSFQLLKDGISSFGFESTGVIDNLLASFDLVNNEAFKPLFENIGATGELFKNLDAAHLLLPDTFQAAAADIGQSIQEIVDKGGDMAKTYALSAPQLQMLWEAQQTYGKITDETTQKILTQAEQQGIVGEQFRSVNDKILTVLLAIADVFGAKIPDGMRATQRAAAETGQTVTNTVGGAIDALPGKARRAASGVSNELGGIKAPDIKVGVQIDESRMPPWWKDEWTYRGGKLEMPDVPALASGGIVRRPTLALVGEAGPEAVVPLPPPLPQLQQGQATIILELDRRQVAEAIVPAIPGVVQRYRLA